MTKGDSLSVDHFGGGYKAWVTTEPDGVKVCITNMHLTPEAARAEALAFLEDPEARRRWEAIWRPRGYTLPGADEEKILGEQT